VIDDMLCASVERVWRESKTGFIWTTAGHAIRQRPISNQKGANFCKVRVKTSYPSLGSASEAMWCESRDEYDVQERGHTTMQYSVLCGMSWEKD
jgi:hypothetical protein